MSKCKCRYC